MELSSVLGNFNALFEKILKSVESTIYKNLDKITDITPKLLKQEPIKKLFFSDKVNGIILIANSFVMFYICYYIICTFISMYNGKKIENFYSFILKMVLVLIFVNNSYYLCEQILNIFSIITNAIADFGKDAVGKEINFVNLNEKVTSIKKLMKDDAISLNGIIRGIISFASINIMINFSIRYVTIIFLIVFSPIGIILSFSKITRGIFKSWLNMLIVNLSIQVITKFILIIPLAFKTVNSDIFKMVVIGTMYLLYKLNTFIKEILNKIGS